MLYLLNAEWGLRPIQLCLQFEVIKVFGSFFFLLNPNLKFVNNQVLLQLEQNEERLSFTSKHKNLNWELHDDLLVKTFQRIVAGDKRYQDY